jgi:hypothetical protein
MTKVRNIKMKEIMTVGDKPDIVGTIEGAGIA